MSIRFKVDPGASYFVAKLEGAVSDEELFNLFRDFYQGNEWKPGMHELADVSEGDLAQVTTAGMRRLADYIDQHFSQSGVETSRTAIYAPRDLPFGIARMYQALSDESPESVQVFRDLGEAKAWLQSGARKDSG